MKLAIHIISLFIIILTNVNGDGCFEVCTDCTSSSECDESVKLYGNKCIWTGNNCASLTNTDGTSYQIIPIPETTSYTISQQEDDCICKSDYFSLNYINKHSCNCYNGIKILMIKYTGNTPLTSITFYHNPITSYQNCLFTNIQPNDIISCSSFPYSKFTSNLNIQITDNNNNNNQCLSSNIDTSCNNNNILNTFLSNCNTLKLIGWVDDDNYICYGDTPSRRLLSSSYDSSSSSSSSSSSDSSSAGSWIKKPKIIYKTPSPESPVVPIHTTIQPTTTTTTTTPAPTTTTIRPSVSPTITITSSSVYAITSTASSSTSTSMSTVSTAEGTEQGDITPLTTILRLSTSSSNINDESTTEETEQDNITPSPLTSNELKDMYCDCQSTESWDDFHYYDANGDLVILSNGENYAESNKGNNMNLYAGRMNDDHKPITGHNMVSNENGVKIVNFYMYLIVLFMIYLCV